MGNRKTIDIGEWTREIGGIVVVWRCGRVRLYSFVLF